MAPGDDHNYDDDADNTVEGASSLPCFADSSVSIVW